MALDIYYNPLSQPSRSVVMFLKSNKIAFNAKVIDLVKGETKTPEYLAMNPNHTVPVMNDDGFILCQSVTMVKYLASKHQVPDHWYPTDSKKRAKVDEVLDWHHTNIRKHGVAVFVNVVIGPLFGRPEPTPEEADAKYKDLDASLGFLESVLLKNQQFLCGDELTIADLFCANEVLQPSAGKRDIYEKHPKVKAWMECVREKLNSAWDEVIEERNQALSSFSHKK